jgi:transcriptional regulator with XRE-family HTH domain
MTNQKRNKIGKDLQKQRKTKNFSRYYVSKITDLSITQIKSIDESKKSYTVDSLIEYAEAIGGEVSIKFK